MKLYRVSGRAFGLVLGCAGLLCVSTAHATTMRIVNWNIEADVATADNATGTFAASKYANGGGIGAISTVLQGIGSLELGDGAGATGHAIDVLALEEVGADTGITSSGSATPSTAQMTAIVTALNKDYPTASYAYSDVADPTTGGTGGGPSTIVYNTKTVTLVSVAPIGTASGSSKVTGAYRAPMQYQLQPVGYNGGAFYVDVSHAKASTTSADAADRDYEANEITASAPVTSGAHVLSMGDFNITGGSTEQTYVDLTKKFQDVGNPAGNWNDGSITVNGATVYPYTYLESEEGYDVRYRDDIQFATASATAGSGSAGIQYDTGSYTVFGNLGSTSLHGTNVNTQTGTYTFAGLSPADNAAENVTVLGALGGTTIGATNADSLTNASDHLPIVADYDLNDVPTPEPAAAALLIFGMIPLTAAAQIN